MKKITREKMESLFPDWDVSSFGDGDFELSSHSPAGENVIMSLAGDTFDEMARLAASYYDDFDPQDHAAQIYHAKHYGSEDEQRFYAGAPADLEDLLEDAKAIDEMYYAVYTALIRAWEEEPDDAEGEEQQEV